MRSDISKLKYLHTFSFIDDSKSDKGETSKFFFKKIVREKSRVIVELLEDRQKLKEERENYSKWKNRIEGVSSSGKMGSTSYTDKYSSSVSSTNYNKSHGVTTNKRKNSPKFSSSSSEDEKKKKKDKKIKKEDLSSSEDEKEKKKKTIKNHKVETEEINNANVNPMNSKTAK